MLYGWDMDLHCRGLEKTTQKWSKHIPLDVQYKCAQMTYVLRERMDIIEIRWCIVQEREKVVMVWTCDAYWWRQLYTEMPIVYYGGTCGRRRDRNTKWDGEDADSRYSSLIMPHVCLSAPAAYPTILFLLLLNCIVITRQLPSSSQHPSAFLHLFQLIPLIYCSSSKFANILQIHFYSPHTFGGGGPGSLPMIPWDVKGKQNLCNRRCLSLTYLRTILRTSWDNHIANEEVMGSVRQSNLQ